MSSIPAAVPRRQFFTGAGEFLAAAGDSPAVDPVVNTVGYRLLPQHAGVPVRSSGGDVGG